MSAARLLLIGLDGFRYDFAARFGAQNLLEFARTGASAEALVPVFPSTTFPNFYSMATGLRPARHGIVAMNFWDRDEDRMFFYQTTASEGRWYRGTPIWLLAEQQGIRTAAFFWPGSDAEISGDRPWQFRKYDGGVTHNEKVATIRGWLQDRDGPGFILTYLSDVDSAGHRFGPDSDEMRQAVLKVDGTVGQLLSLAGASTNVVIVSDHGVATVDKKLDLTAEADFGRFRVANEAPMTQLYSRDRGLVETTFSRLKGRHPDYDVFRQEDLPARWRYAGPRVGDLVIIPNGPHIVEVRAPGLRPIPDLKGMHGYDPAEFPAMDGILLARGPGIRAGARAGRPSTPDVFALAARLLDLKEPPGLDASPPAIAGMIARSR